MQGLDFRNALRDEMSLVAEPPPMSETAMLEAAKKSVRRRKAAWASVGSAAAVVVLAVGTAFTVSFDDRAGPAVTPSPPYGEWTETAGPHYDNGVMLLDEVVDAVPSGLETPSDLVWAGHPGAPGEPLRNHEATINWDGSRSYSATVPVARAGMLGTLTVLVVTPGYSLFDGRAGCRLTAAVSEFEGKGTFPCELVPVDGVTVPVTTEPDEQRAAYRHPDGGVVMVEQRPDFPGSGKPAMAEMPLTRQQLAELAVDSRLHLN